MKTWAIKYVRTPTLYNCSSQALVDAETQEDAIELLARQLRQYEEPRFDRGSIYFASTANYVYYPPVEWDPREIKGHVIKLDGFEL